jgi:hypothetical protein
MIRGRRIKLRYAHQGGRNPPRIIVHGNQTALVPDSYSRYLANVFRKKFDLFATPVAIEYRTDSNPYNRNTDDKPHPGTPGDKPTRRGQAGRGNGTRAAPAGAPARFRVKKKGNAAAKRRGSKPRPPAGQD